MLSSDKKENCSHDIVLDKKFSTPLRHDPCDAIPLQTLGIPPIFHLHPLMSPGHRIQPRNNQSPGIKQGIKQGIK